MMMTILSALLSEFWPLIAGAAAVLGAMIYGRQKGKADAERKQAWQSLTDYKKTRKAVDDESNPSGADDARKRLRERDPGKP